MPHPDTQTVSSDITPSDASVVWSVLVALWLMALGAFGYFLAGVTGATALSPTPAWSEPVAAVASAAELGAIDHWASESTRLPVNHALGIPSQGGLR